MITENRKTIGKPVILLEFNELCPSLMTKFMKAGKLPNFERLQSQSIVFTTEVQEEQDNLEPWIQWVTVHTGVGYKEHRIYNLGDGHRLSFPTTYGHLSQQGYTVWLCGSMNLRSQPGFKGAMLPDPWSASVKPTPSEMNDFFRFVELQVQEHTNDDLTMTAGDYFRFLKFMFTHGLSVSSVGAIFRQLLGERMGFAGRWQRAVILDKLQWDVFAWYYRRLRPSLSTFFLNSTAHFQHLFWRNMEPEKFTVKPTEEDQRKYSGAVEFGYREMDKLVGKCLDLAGDEATIVFTTALSQQPFTHMDDLGGKVFHRPHRMADVTAYAGLSDIEEIAPVMAEQFHIYFKTEEAAVLAEERLSRLLLDGEPAMEVNREGTDIFTGLMKCERIPESALLSMADDPDSERPFYDLFYEVDIMKSGMHHPDGILWIQSMNGIHRTVDRRVPLESVAPTLLGLLGVDPPATMKHPSLLASDDRSEAGAISAA